MHEVQKRRHGLVGIEQQLIALDDLLAHVARKVEGGVCLRLEGVEEQLLLGGFWNVRFERVHVAQVERDVHDGHGTARQFEGAADGLDGRALEVAADVQVDGLQAQALLEDALHVLAIVLVFLDALAVGVDVGVADDPDDGAVLRNIGAEAAVDAGHDDVFDQDVVVLARVAGNFDHARQRGRDLDEAEQAGLIGLGRDLEAAYEVQTAVAQVGERMARVDDERRDDGGDVGLEEALHEGALVAHERARLQADHAALGELVLKRVEHSCLALVQRRQSVEDAVNLLGGREVALVVARLVLERCEVRKAADANHEELIEVALEDGDELQALEQRHGLVVGLGEHAVVEAQPRKLAVLRVGEVVAVRRLDTSCCVAFLLLVLLAVLVFDSHGASVSSS